MRFGWKTFGLILVTLLGISLVSSVGITTINARGVAHLASGTIILFGAILIAMAMGSTWPGFSVRGLNLLRNGIPYHVVSRTEWEGKVLLFVVSDDKKEEFRLVCVNAGEIPPERFILTKGRPLPLQASSKA